VSQASAVAVPGVLAPDVKGFKAQMDRLRERMRSLGFSYHAVAASARRRLSVSGSCPWRRRVVSLRELARQVPCDASHLLKAVPGRDGRGESWLSS
jgi:glutathionyl-hydroquinone reductase